MIEPEAEARIRDFKRRIAQDPTSPLFLSLAEEYRTAGRLSEGIRILEKGLSTHARYVSAQVALGRAYLEADRIEESVALFSRVLATDPGNIVAARSLADIYLARGERLEAVKKYKLYRALSGDRRVDEVIEGIERDLEGPLRPTAEPSGRVLADLYFSQGHYGEAVRLYRDLESSNPGDPELERLRMEAEARSAAAEPAVFASGQDRAVRLRGEKVQALKRWLSVVQSR